MPAAVVRTQLLDATAVRRTAIKRIIAAAVAT
jgi:hypothetical protein